MNMIQMDDEVFCMKYELNALAEITLKSESERWIPGFMHETTEHDHISRYKLACNYAYDKSVLDIACGVGKGSEMLLTDGKAVNVKGVDIQIDTVKYANLRFKIPNIEFEAGNAETFCEVSKYDLIVSFETIEHLGNYKQFLDNVWQSLKINGGFIVSTPIAETTINTPTNPYHSQEWGFVEFQNLISEKFEIEEVYVQYHPITLSWRTIIHLPKGFKQRFRKKWNTYKGIHEIGERIPELSQTAKFSTMDLIDKYDELYPYIKPRKDYQILICRKKDKH